MNSGMSSPEELVFIHARDSANPADRDVDLDVDFFFEKEVEDPDADDAAQRQCARSTTSPFHTPVPGAHVDAKTLQNEIGADSVAPAS